MSVETEIESGGESEVLDDESISSPGDAPAVLTPGHARAEETEPVAPVRLENISDAARERISVGPVPDWVLEQTFDPTSRPETQGRCDVLLSDDQVHAAKQQNYARRAQRLETFNAVQHAGQWKVQFDPATQWLVVHSVMLRRGEERHERANVAKFRVLQREDGLEHLVVSGEVTVVLVLEDVRLGDILDASFTITSRERILPEKFQYLVSAVSSVPLRFFHFRALFPTGDAMQWKTPRASMVPSVREYEGLTEWRWELRDVPPPVGEARIPSSVFRGPWIQISNFVSWAELAEAVHRAWREDFEGEELRRQVRTIAEAEPTLAGRALLAINFVQDEIRYLSDNLELGGQIPSAPSEVLRRRFGDCKDKSFLLVHLLRSLGLPARAWLINTKLDERLRSMLPANMFNHVVIEFELEGQRRWVEATAYMQGGGLLERSTPYFRVGLPIAPETQGLEALPLPVSTGTYLLSEHYRLDTTGAPVTLVVTTRATGGEADSQRQIYVNRGLHGMAADFLQRYRGMYYGAKRLGEFEWRDDREKNVVETAESYELPNVMQRHPKGAYFRHEAYLVQSILRLPNESANRKFSVSLAYPRKWEHRILVQSPKFFSKGITRNHEKTDHFSFSRVRDHGNGVWTETFQVETFAPIVLAKDFQAFRKKVQQLWPTTTVAYTLPRGVKVPPPRAGASLLPAEEASTAEIISASAIDPAPVPEYAAPALCLGEAVPESPETPLARLHADAGQAGGEPVKTGATPPPLIFPSETGQPTGSAAFGPVRMSKRKRRRSSSRAADSEWLWRWLPWFIFVNLLFALKLVFRTH